jgi:glutaminyl-tRNA synthetase
VHWVSVQHAVAVEIRSYDRLFSVPAPSADSFLQDLNPDSLHVQQGFVEPAIVAHSDRRFQFERQGYFCKDPELEGVFNKTVSLREGF